MRNVIFQTENTDDIQLLVSLLQRLNINFKVEQPSSVISPQIHDVYGSWKSEESGTELVDAIYSARNDKWRDISL